MARLTLLLLLLISHAQAETWPESFDRAKSLLRYSVFHDQANSGDSYCGCKWQWRGKTGGVIDPSSCDYKPRKQPTRGNRIEYEHIVPAWEIGHQRLCWQNGGRKNCASNDPVFSRAYTDPHNLTIVNGELNADRSNYRFQMIPGEPRAYGACNFEVSFKERIAEPPESAQGMIARTYLYMRDTYGLRLSRKQQQLFNAWNAAHPPSSWEKIRNDRITKIIGKDNTYVSNWINAR